MKQALFLYAISLGAEMPENERGIKLVGVNFTA